MVRMVSVLYGNTIAGEVWCGCTATMPLGYSTVVSTLLWGLALVAGVLALGFVLLVLRRKYHPQYATDKDAAGFSMDRLDRLHREGGISDEEFRHLRRVALGLDIPAAPVDNGSSSSGPEQADAEGAGPGDADCPDEREKDDE